MTTAACEWLEIAREDYELANLMYDNSKYLYAVSMCRQTVEEAVKAVYKNRFDKTPPLEQNLVRLAEKAGLLAECPAEWKAILSSLNALSAYQSDLREFAAWFSESNGRETAPGLVTTIDLKEYQAYLITVKRRKPATVNRKMIAVKKWLACSGCHVRLPKAVREQRKQPKTLERSEQNALLREVERSADARDIALVRVMLSCGLRVGETVRLKTSDVMLGERQGVITVRSGKGNKYREVPVPAETRRALRECLVSAGKKEGWLFPGRNGGHLTTRAAQMLIAGTATGPGWT